MPQSNGKRRSISLDEEFAKFIEDYMEKNKFERLRAGKDVSIISVVREGLFLWAEKEGVLEELLKYLKQIG